MHRQSTQSPRLAHEHFWRMSLVLELFRVVTTSSATARVPGYCQPNLHRQRKGRCRACRTTRVPRRRAVMRQGALCFQRRNFISASVVSCGCSSSTQCPVSFRTTTVTSEATSFNCAPWNSPKDFSPPTVNTGIVSFVFESSPKSLWVIGCEL